MYEHLPSNLERNRLSFSPAHNKQHHRSEQNTNQGTARRRSRTTTVPLENKGDGDEDERGRGVAIEEEHQRVHALIQGHLAHDVHAGVHEPDQNDGGVGLGAATHLGNKQHFLAAAAAACYDARYNQV